MPAPEQLSAAEKEERRRALLTASRSLLRGGSGSAGRTAYPSNLGGARSVATLMTESRSATECSALDEPGTDAPTSARSTADGFQDSLDAAFHGQNGGALRAPQLLLLEQYFSGRVRLMGLYISAVLGEVTVIEEHQVKFRREFTDFMTKRHKTYTRVEREEVQRSRRIDLRTGELPTCGAHYVWLSRHKRHTIMGQDEEDGALEEEDEEQQGISVHAGYIAVEHAIIIEWLSEFLSRDRSDPAARYDSLTDIPRSLLLPFFDPALSKLLGGFTTAFADSVLVPHSLDRRLCHLAASGAAPVVALHKYLFPYQHLEALACDLEALNYDKETDGESRAVMEEALRLFDERQRLAGGAARLDLAHVALTCQLYVRYSLANASVCREALDHRRDDPEALAAVLFALVVGDHTTLDPIENPLLCLLSERGRPPDGTPLDALARMACDVRAWVLGDEYVAAQAEDGVARGTLLAALHRRTAALAAGAGTLREMCRLSLASTTRLHMRRQVTVSAERVPFTRLLHQLESQTHLVRERRALREWAARCAGWVRYDDVLWAKCMTADMPPPPSAAAPLDRHAEYRDLHQQRGLDLLQHIQLCDYNVIALRLGPGVSLEEVRLSLDYYCAVFPCCMPESVSGMFHVGLDAEGVFVVATRLCHALLTQTMLLAACTTPDYRHNVPLFPALVRLFFCTYDGSRPEPPPPMTYMEDNQLLHPDHHALYCFSNIVGHWLGLPTAAPTDMIVPLDGRTKLYVGRNDGDAAREELRQRSLLGIEDHDAAAVVARRSFIPDPTDDAFMDLKALHSFAVRLEAALGRAFDTTRVLTDGLAEALAGHLELNRPRRIGTETARELSARLEEARDERYAALIEVLHAHCAAADERAAQGSAGGAAGARVAPGSKRTREAMEGPGGSVVLSEPSLVRLIYAASDSGHLGPDLTRLLFLEGGLAPVGRPAVSLGNLRCSARIADESGDERQYTRDITGGYAHMFSARNVGCTRTVKASVAERMSTTPVEPLGHLLRLLESAVAPVTLAEALGAPPGREGGIGDAPPPPCRVWCEFHRTFPSSPGLMDNRTARSLTARFDFVGYIGARPRMPPAKLDPHRIRVEDVPSLDEDPERLHKLRTVRARLAPLIPQDALPSIDAQSYTPIQFWPASDGALPASGSQSPTISVTYLESFFSLATFPGGTYSNHLLEAGIDPEKGASWSAALFSSMAAVTVTPDMLRGRPLSTLGERADEGVARESLIDESTLDASAASTARALIRPVPSAQEVQRIRSASRLDRLEFLRILNASYQLATRFGAAAPDAVDPLCVAAQLSDRLKALAEHSARLRSRDGAQRHDSIYDERLFPFRFASREELGRFICSVLRSPMPGESHAQRMERLQANLRLSRGRQILDFLCKLYALCDSELYDARKSYRPEEDAYSEMFETDIASSRDLRTFSQLVQEAMRRGLLGKLAKAEEGGEEEIDFTDVEEFFDEITRDK